MRPLLFAVIAAALTLLLASTKYFAPTVSAASCTSGSTVPQGGTLNVSGTGFGGNSLAIGMVDGFGGQDTPLPTPTGGADPFTVSESIPVSTQVGTWRAYVDAGGFGKVACINTFQVTDAGGGSGPGGIGVGTITPPVGIPTTGGDPSGFVAGLIRGAISFLIVAAFIIALLWTIFAGLRFITAGGDEKTVSASWSQIYWGLIGMVVVLGSFAIIRLVETFFNVNIISGGFQLPTR